jgi:hypothetical protein
VNTVTIITAIKSLKVKVPGLDNSKFEAIQGKAVSSLRFRV